MFTFIFTKISNFFQWLGIVITLMWWLVTHPGQLFFGPPEDWGDSMSDSDSSNKDIK